MKGLNIVDSSKVVGSSFDFFTISLTLGFGCDMISSFSFSFSWDLSTYFLFISITLYPLPETDFSIPCFLVDLVSLFLDVHVDLGTSFSCWPFPLFAFKPLPHHVGVFLHFQLLYLSYSPLPLGMVSHSELYLLLVWLDHLTLSLICLEDFSLEVGQCLIVEPSSLFLFFLALSYPS